MKEIVLVGFLLLFTSTVYAQSFDLSGDWKGSIDGVRRQVNFKLHIQKSDSLSGTIEIQGIELPLKKINFIQPDSIFISFRAGPASIAKFKGSFQTDTLIKGIYYQRGYAMPFKLSRFEKKTDNQPPLPYNHKDLIIHNDSIKIGGTLTWPEDQTTKHLVITISGSGAQNRDGATPITDFEPYAELAHGLTKKGIAVFRYDDRGVGQSTGNYPEITLRFLADDVETVISYFSSKHDSIPSFSNIILLGHSLGGVVAGKAAVKNEAVDKLILMASPALPTIEMSRYQVRRQLKKMLTKKQIAAEFAARDKLIAAIKENKGLEKAKKQYQKHTLEFLKAIYDSTKSNLKMMAQIKTQKMIALYQNRWKLLLYNPVKDLKQLNIPVLVLFGDKDTQVPVELNKKPIKDALETADVPYKIVVMEEANHLFQEAKTGEVWEYATLKSEFVDGFLRTIAQWIKK